MLQETKVYEESVAKSANFKGEVTLVPIDKPEDAQTQTIEKATKELSFPVNSATGSFLLHVNGNYSTKTTKCDVDQQILLKGTAEAES